MGARRRVWATGRGAEGRLEMGLATRYELPQTATGVHYLAGLCGRRALAAAFRERPPQPPIWRHPHFGIERAQQPRAVGIRHQNRLPRLAIVCACGECSVVVGVFGYPKEDAARIAVEVVRAFLAAKDAEEMKVVFCCFSEWDKRVYEGLVDKTV